jgi:hypothetical protein
VRQEKTTVRGEALQDDRLKGELSKEISELSPADGLRKAHVIVTASRREVLLRISRHDVMSIPIVV